jgi:hypothetical protein
MQAGFFCVAVCVALALLLSHAPAQTEPLAMARFAPDEMKWDRAPLGGLRANLVGDEHLPGLYIYRVRFPENFRVQPYFHPDDRVVTVMSGTLHKGQGNRFDENAMKALP